ncbi:piggyBac transposable element-derived protein 4-like [Homalodisca vitripennis]|nr:piggyBac transposable element-derived protein 4-like [Homalodisca vitripennis]
MSSEPDPQHEIEENIGSSVDDTDEDPDFLPSESDHDSSDDEGEATMEIETNDMNGGDSGENDGEVMMDEWTEFKGRQQEFLFTSTSEYHLNMANDAKPVDYYLAFITDDIIQMMVVETNRNASKVLRETRLNRSSRLNKWAPTDDVEMWKFIGILIWMGLSNHPRITDYWSGNILYKNTVASQVMSRNRFQLMLRFWHFNDHAAEERDGRIAKILPLISKMNDIFLNKKSAGQDLVIDESMIPFRGRLSFRQYIPNKAHKYGLKIFKLCDQQGYTYCIKVYMGKGTIQNENNELVSTSVVMELMEHNLDKGHILYVDNYYTSVQLAKNLLARRTHLVGTVRANRKGLPADVMKAQIKKGEMKALENEDGIVVTKWKDKREVRMLSTKHEVEYVLTGKIDKKGNDIFKPLVIVEYNKGKMGIDVSDQLSSYSTGVRKSRRWYHKAAEEIVLGTAVVNSWLAYTNAVKARPTAGGHQKKHCMSITTFKENLAVSLMGLDNNTITPVKGTGHHYLTISQNFTGEGKGRHRVRRYCKMCYKKAVQVSGRDVAKKLGKVNTFCEQCPEKPYLCKDCFREVHK